MNRRTFLIAASLASIVSLAGLTGCFGAAAGSNGNGNGNSNGNGNGNGNNATNDSSNSSSYQQVDAETAKELMDTEDDYVILDVRTQAEYDEATSPAPSSSRTTPWRLPPRTHCPTRASSSSYTAAAAIAASRPRKHSWTSATPMSSSSGASTAGPTRSNSGRPPGSPSHPSGSPAARLYQAKRS